MRCLSLTVFLALSLIAAVNPWQDSDVVAPSIVARDIKTPLLLQVGFAALYRASHIPGSVYVGPASKPEGIDAIKAAVAGQPKTREIVLYCGCCPMEKCPNMRTAFATLHELGFTHVKVMMIPENLKTDWTDKGYPIERHAEGQSQ